MFSKNIFLHLHPCKWHSLNEGQRSSHVRDKHHSLFRDKHHSLFSTNTTPFFRDKQNSLFEGQMSFLFTLSKVIMFFHLWKVKSWFQQWWIYFVAIKTTLVYPATDKHIAKYSQQEMYLVEETPEDYKNITLPDIESSKFSIQVWWKFDFHRLEIRTSYYLFISLATFITWPWACSGL